MRSARLIHVVGCHAEGEVGDVIVGGVAPPPGDSIWAQSRHVAAEGSLRNFVLQEPRGGVFRHVNLLVPPITPGAHAAFIIMEPEDTPPMSGSNAICVATVLLDTGIVPMQEPETHIILEAPGGLIEVTATCRDGKAERIRVRNHPSFADRLDAKLEVEGHGTITVDTAYGGDSFCLVDARALGFSLAADEARDITELGMKIVRAANRQLGFRHPVNEAWNHISFCQFAGPLATEAGTLSGANAVAIRPGKIDRSPCGTGCSARMAVLHAKGLLGIGDAFIGRSIIGSRFDCRIEAAATIGDRPGIVPSISGRAWITSLSQLALDPADPWPTGYRVNDTWPIWHPS